MPVNTVKTQLDSYVRLIRRQWRLQVQLLAMETQRAAESLVAIWLLSWLAGLLLLSSWVFFMVMLGFGLQAMGLLIWQILMLLWLLQVVALLLCLRLIRYHSQFLCFPATQQSWSAAVSTGKMKPEPHQKEPLPCQESPKA